MELNDEFAGLILMCRTEKLAEYNVFVLLKIAWPKNKISCHLLLYPRNNKVA